MGKDKNIMPIHIFRILFPQKNKKEQMAVTENKNVVLKAYNKTIIPQLGICDVMLDNKNKQSYTDFL